MQVSSLVSEEKSDHPLMDIPSSLVLHEWRGSAILMAGLFLVLLQGCMEDLLATDDMQVPTSDSAIVTPLISI